jgi:hypothetical protein
VVEYKTILFFFVKYFELNNVITMMTKLFKTRKNKNVNARIRKIPSQVRTCGRDSCWERRLELEYRVRVKRVIPNMGREGRRNENYQNEERTKKTIKKMEQSVEVTKSLK